jgi:uncharacterized protein YdeI (YjbR/CyaY-like superfamily)
LKEFERIEVASRAELRGWLAAHYTQAESVWLVTFKKAAGERYLPYDAIVEEAMCFGWVDSVPRALDAERSMRLLSPRKAGSAWSLANKARVERLIQSGLMAEPGLAVIGRAKVDGSWHRLDAVESLVIPDDLAAALKRHEGGAEYFACFPRSSKRLILEWIGTAKRAETRSQRVEETARLAARNQRAHHHKA